MAEFTLDTSGDVPMYDAELDDHYEIRWTDLDLFPQGYVEALLRTLPYKRGGAFPVWFGFSDLAPETLARIIADCARWFDGGHGAVCDIPDDTALAGARLWRMSQWGHLTDFPPLTVALNDDGKVYLREAA